MVPAEVRPAPPPPDSFARIVIATRDRPDSLAKCLDSLLAQSHQNFEIVVVDNCPSSAATRDLIATRYAGTGRIHYRREDRAGLGHAHNAGLLGNAAGVVAFTDDDVRVDSRWLSALLRNFVRSIAKASGAWTMRAFKDEAIEKIRKQVGAEPPDCGTRAPLSC